MMYVDKFQISVDGSEIKPQDFEFNLVCTRCGSTRTRMIPTSYYNDATQKYPEMITMHLMCTNCHNEIEYIVRSDKKLPNS